MKTILYNPIFINPQAYYVFPRLTRYLQPDNESTAEPANYIGTIEVKVIAYGDTTLKRTYTNTDSIDLSEFKNTWIRISLFTKVGSCVLGEWKIGNMESDLPYIDPEVLASLKAVVIVGNKTNNDSDRAIVKNLVDPDNPFVISNAAYTEGSGYADKDSPYYGAFVTDGIDDLITSTKTVQEMLGGSNEITVVSMAHFIKGESNAPEICRINQIRRDTRSIRNSISKIGKSGIFGYTYKNGVTTINNILGDKNDCTAEGNLDGIVAPFSVEGYYYNNNSNPLELCSIAWYWTIIANKVLITDQINQVIAYFNLDRTLKPDILCNVKKQGITNENHAEFGDRLIDFSGNGRYIQLNNLAWDGDSGIGKYNYPNWKVNVTQGNKYTRIVYYDSINGTYSANFKGITDLYKSYGLSIEIRVNRANTVDFHSIKEDGIYTITPPDDTTSMDIRFGGENVYNASCNITITQIPSHAGGLCLDGVNDFGKVTGMPVYKDYTVVIDREIFANIGAISSKNNPGAFVETAGNSVYSFGQATSGLNFISTRSISYLSKYSYCGQSITAGAAKDGTDMWLGTIRDNDSRFFNGAIYSLMSFPYSMSEFLIERQLKKHKLGTLYLDMVEFRPVIKSNVLLDAKPTFVIRGTSTYLNAGDYVPENSQIWVSIKMNNIADRITKFTVNGKTIDIPENAYSEVTLQYGFPFVIDKSPQKISITIEQDENYVLFNPVINSNYDNYKLTFHLREYEKLINIGDYIPKGTYIRANLYLKNNIDKFVTFTFNGVNIDYVKSSVSDLAYNIRQIYNYDSPQEINITIDEYIRYEDIVQPYPAFYEFTDENRNLVTWGSKIKVGSTITRIKAFANSNLLKDLYNISYPKLNGVASAGSKYVVERQMVFTCTATYLLDDNEPKCILSPRLLRIPNSSYKILGYIPDISGHGNHGKINNSAYAGMSGANGYKYDYETFLVDKVLARIDDYRRVTYFAAKNSVGFFDINSASYKGRIKLTGVKKAIDDKFIDVFRIYTNSPTNNEAIDIYEDGEYDVDIKGADDATRLFFFALTSLESTSTLNTPIVIEQIGEYEGAYCLDGVDDFVTIPTTVGGKQVLMKVNWDSSNSALLYDQRGYNNEFAIYNGSADSDGNPIPAYQGRNNGQTYIDGILNSNIKASELRAITHNITITNELSAGVNKFSPVIGSNRVHNTYFTNMALYDFMLFDNISTDDKIKQLNEYVGIEGNTEWRKTK